MLFRIIFLWWERCVNLGRKLSKKSVDNEWGRSHDISNLFIVDSSIFVTSAGVNPVSTMQALALYIADKMKKPLKSLFN